MRLSFLLGLSLLCVSPVYAQAPTPGVTDNQVQEVTTIEINKSGDSTQTPQETPPGDVSSPLKVIEGTTTPTEVSSSEKPTPKIVRAIVDSREIRNEFLYRDPKSNQLYKVVAVETEYCYLMEGGEKLWLRSKYKRVKDSRPALQKNPVATKTAIKVRQQAKFWGPVVQVGTSCGTFLITLMNH